MSGLFAWLLSHGHGPEEVVTGCGIDVGGGRVPDLNGGTTVHRHTLNDAGEYDQDPDGPQPLARPLTTVPDLGR